MAGTASHHKPAYQNDREQSNSNPFLQKVGSNGKHHGGRPLSSYLSPEYTDDYALTSEKIVENYPFFGTLMKQENGIYKRKEVITKDSPKTIDDVQEIYGAGAYQLRLKTEEGTEEQLNFKVHGKEEADSSPQQNQTQAIDQQFIADLRRDLKQEIRQDYQDTINRLEKRNQAKEDELNELSGKVRRLNMELAETERTAAKSVRDDIKDFEEKVDGLKEEIQELKFENFELQQELKYADVDGGFNWKESLQDVMKNPDVMTMLQPMFAKMFGGQPVPQPQPASLGAPGMDSSHSTNPANTEFNSPPQNNARTGESHTSQNNETGTDASHASQPLENENQNKNGEFDSPQQNQQAMQQHLQTFMANIIKRIASALTHDNPNKEAINTFVVDQITALNDKGIKVPAAAWVSISKTLIDYALQQGISKEKAVDVIYPMLQNLGAAKNILRYTPANAAANMLIEQFSIDIQKDAQREFLVSILEAFKAKIKEPDAANA